MLQSNQHISNQTINVSNCSKAKLTGKPNQILSLILLAVLSLSSMMAFAARTYNRFNHQGLGANVVLAQTMEASNKFPMNPDPVMTPGALCTSPSEHRYPEHIAYCERNVSTDTKKAIISKYDSELGYKIRQMNRGDFKIDHLIPLSIGGSNDIKNLWPQHKSVYAYSDKIESHLSNLMIDAKIKQKEAIELIKDCKLHLEKCADIQKYLETLY